MLNDIQVKTPRMNLTNAPSPLCTFCVDEEPDSSAHALLQCGHIRIAASQLFLALASEIPDLTLERILFLDFCSEDLLPPSFLTATVLSQVWTLRVEKQAS